MTTKTYLCGSCGATVATGKHCPSHTDPAHQAFAQNNGYLYKEKTKP